MTTRREQAGAVVFSVLMIVSMVVGSVAFGGLAAADGSDVAPGDNAGTGQLFDTETASEQNATSGSNETTIETESTANSSGDGDTGTGDSDTENETATGTDANGTDSTDTGESVRGNETASESGEHDGNTSADGSGAVNETTDANASNTSYSVDTNATDTEGETDGNGSVNDSGASAESVDQSLSATTADEGTGGGSMADLEIAISHNPGSATDSTPTGDGRAYADQLDIFVDTDEPVDFGGQGDLHLRVVDPVTGDAVTYTPTSDARTVPLDEMYRLGIQNDGTGEPEEEILPFPQSDSDLSFENIDATVEGETSIYTNETFNEYVIELVDDEGNVIDSTDRRLVGMGYEASFEQNGETVRVTRDPAVDPNWTVEFALVGDNSSIPPSEQVIDTVGVNHTKTDEYFEVPLDELGADPGEYSWTLTIVNESRAELDRERIVRISGDPALGTGVTISDASGPTQPALTVNETVSFVSPTGVASDERETFDVTVRIDNTSLDDTASGEVDVAFEGFNLSTDDDELAGPEEDLRIDYTGANVSNGTISVTDTVTGTAPSTAGAYPVNVTDVEVATGSDTDEFLLEDANVTIETVDVNDRSGDDGEKPNQVDVDPDDLPGNGTEDDPYRIANASELQAIEDDLDANYTLVTDIDASNTAQWNNRRGFDPIGDAPFNDSTPPAFTGSFDGDNHTITELTIDRPDANYVGLFGYSDGGNSTIQHVAASGDVNGLNYVGGLAGYSDGGNSTIQHVTASGDVNGSNHVGGLVGRQDGNVLIQNATASGDVNGSGAVGGLVGTNAINGTIQNATASGDVNGSDQTGGFVGISFDSTTIQNATASGDVNGSSSTGGLVGYNFGNIVIQSATASGTVDGSDQTGGLIGYSSGNTTIQSATVSGDVNGSDQTGGLVGIRFDNTVIQSATASGAVNGYDSTGGLVGASFDNMVIQSATASGAVNGARNTGGLVGDSGGNSMIQNATASGTVNGSDQTGGLVGDSGDTMILNATASGTVTGSDRTGGLVGDSGRNTTIQSATASGAVNGSELTGGLVGVSFDNTTIQNATASGDVNGTDDVGGLIGTASDNTTILNAKASGDVNGSDDNVGGLVGAADNAAIQNVVASGDVEGSDQTGGLIGSIGRFRGSAGGTVRNATASGDVNGSSRVGGLVGESRDTTIRSVIASGDVNGSGNRGNEVGGLIGRNSGNAINVTSSGKVNGAGFAVGGLIGSNSGNITKATAFNNVTGSREVGGLAGDNFGTIQDATASGDVHGIDEVGGLIGVNRPDGTVKRAAVSGSVNGNGVVGGLVGKNREGTIKNATASGSVNESGTGAVGGLIGFYNSGTVQDVFATGRVTGTDRVGGLVGSVSADNTLTITDAYWDEQTTGQSTSAGSATGLTTAQMQGQAARTNMSGLDFETTWRITESYPELRPFSEPESDKESGILAVESIRLPESVTQGQEITANITLKNTGNTDLTQNVSFTSSYVAEDRNAGGGGGGPPRSITVEANSQKNVSYSPIIPDDAGSFTVTVSTDHDTASATISNISDPTPTVNKATSSVQPDTVSVGETQEYEIFVEVEDFPGSSTEITDGDIDIQFEGFQFVSENGESTVEEDLTIGYTSADITNGTLTISTTASAIPPDAVGPRDVVVTDLRTDENEYLIEDERITIDTIEVSDESDNGGNEPVQIDVDPDGLSGTGTEDNPYQIANASELQAMEDDLDANYTLVTDIDASNTAQWNNGSGFDPIGDSPFDDSIPPEFTGSLYGAGHTIDGLTIDRPAENNVGLFGAIGNSGTVESLTLTEVQTNGSESTASLVGLNRGTISEVNATVLVNGSEDIGGLVGTNFDGGVVVRTSVRGHVTGSGNVGGLVGINNGNVRRTGDINQSFAGVTVTGSSDVGGLVGRNRGNATVSYSTATGNVSGSSTVGGLIGSSDEGVVKHANATGRINGSDLGVGGLIGQIRRTTLTQTYATGNVTGGQRVGGLLGINTANSTTRQAYATGAVTGDRLVGGLVGFNDDDAIVERSSANGSVRGVEDVGGLIGMNEDDAIVRQSYAMARVNGSSAVGGLVGYNNRGTTVNESYATGAVSGSSSVGGLIGQRGSNSEIVRSYWDTESTGQRSSTGGIGLNTSQMQKHAARTNMTGLDFENTWRVTDGYPALRVFSERDDGGDTGGLVPFPETTRPGQTAPPSLAGKFRVEQPVAASTTVTLLENSSAGYSMNITAPDGSENVTFYLQERAISASQDIDDVRMLLDGQPREFTVIADAGPGNSPWIAFTVPEFSTRTVTFTSESENETAAPSIVAPANATYDPSNPLTIGTSHNATGVIDDGDVAIRMVNATAGNDTQVALNDSVPVEGRANTTIPADSLAGNVTVETQLYNLSNGSDVASDTISLTANTTGDGGDDSGGTDGGDGSDGGDKSDGDDGSDGGDGNTGTPSFAVSRLDPQNVTVTVGDTLTVAATIENVGTAKGTQPVEYRIGGAVMANETVTLSPGENTTVEFTEIETENLVADDYEHGSFTENASQTGTLTVEADAGGGTDDSTPGFGNVVSLLALVLFVLGVRRRGD